MKFKKLKWDKIKGNKLVIQESTNHILNQLNLDFRIIIGYDNKMYLVDFTSDTGVGYDTRPIESVAEGEALAQELFEEKCKIILEVLVEGSDD